MITLMMKIEFQMKNKQNIQKVDKNMGTKYKKSVKLKKKIN